MKTIDYKTNLVDLTNSLAEKAEKINEEKSREVNERLSQRRQEAFRKDSKTQSILDRADQLLNDRKKKEKEVEIERLMKEKHKDVDEIVSKNLSLPNERQQKLNHEMRSMLKELL